MSNATLDRQFFSTNGKHHENGHPGGDAANPARPAKPAISQRKLAANRANARKSTGPRSAEGKARSSLNALKHGLCRNTALLPSECPTTYQTFLAEVEEELRPRTVMQRLLFPHIANLLWKLQRTGDVERELFLKEGERLADESGEAPPPCRILAESFAGPPSAFMLAARYERSMQSMLLRMLSRYYWLKKHHPHMEYEDDPCPWNDPEEEELGPLPPPDDDAERNEPTDAERNEPTATSTSPPSERGRAERTASEYRAERNKPTAAVVASPRVEDPRAAESQARRGAPSRGETGAANETNPPPAPSEKKREAPALLPEELCYAVRANHQCAAGAAQVDE